MRLLIHQSLAGCVIGKSDRFLHSILQFSFLLLENESNESHLLSFIGKGGGKIKEIRDVSKFNSLIPFDIGSFKQQHKFLSSDHLKCDFNALRVVSKFEERDIDDSSKYKTINDIMQNSFNNYFAVQTYANSFECELKIGN